MPERWLIDAELRPHRSLGRAGFIALMTAMSLACFGAGAVFALAGAWPVLGFFGLDVLLIWLAFRLNFRGGRLVERVRLSAAACEVERVEPSGRVRRWSFQPGWLKAEMEAPGEHRCRLSLSGRGAASGRRARVVIGAFLTPAERREVHAALSGALARLREAPGIQASRPSTARMS